MKQALVILGRQPALGLAELESLLEANIVHSVGNSAAVIDLHHSEVPFHRLGGSIKLAKLLHIFPDTNWKSIETYLLTNLPNHLATTPEGKLRIGLSAFGMSVSTKQLLATGLTIKKALRAYGKSVRLVPNNAPALNSAQVIHNKLYNDSGWELLFIRDGSRVIMGLTTQEQDIEAFAARDQQRPFRDARVGMLPPKLARVIINLAAAKTDPQSGAQVLDPFCGTGVILQEATMLGFTVTGSDIDPRMVEYSTKNLHWLQDQPGFPVETKNGDYFRAEVADAIDATWDLGAQDHVACETYLGRPFAHSPTPEVLTEVMQDVSVIHYKFLENLARQTKPGFRLCIAVPAWFVDGRVHHLKTLASLEKLGYNRLSFSHASDEDLIYHREGQIVGRELVTLIRK